MNIFVLTSYFFLLSIGVSWSQLTRLTILHSNDIHGNFAGDEDGFGGVPKTVHLIKKFKAKATKQNPVIYLNAGDIFTGSVWYSIHRTNIAADMVKLLKPDALALGNHEFDEGIKGLRNFLRSIKQPVLCANGIFKEEATISPYMTASMILKLAYSDQQIGIIGYINSGTGNLADTGKVRFKDDVETVRREAAKLTARGVKLIIALGHSGFEIDKKIAVIPQVDVVVGGHSHTLMYTGKVPTNDKPIGNYPQVVQKPNGVEVPVVQVGYGGKYLGKLIVTFGDEGEVLQFEGEAIVLDDKVDEDQESLQLLNYYRPAVERLQRQVIGHSKVFLQGAQACRRAECNLGNLLTDSFCQYKADSMRDDAIYWTDTPIGIINAGTIRNSINASKKVENALTIADVMSAFPYENQLVSFNLRSNALLEVLEYSVKSNGETSYGEFLQVSGLKVVFNMTKPAFSRVARVEVRCGECNIPTFFPLKYGESYRVITTEYLVGGGDGYKVMKKERFNFKKEGIADREVLIKYIEEQLRPITTNVENRIVLAPPRGMTARISGCENIKAKNELICLGILFVYVLINW